MFFFLKLAIIKLNKILSYLWFQCLATRKNISKHLCNTCITDFHPLCSKSSSQQQPYHIISSYLASTIPYYTSCQICYILTRTLLIQLTVTTLGLVGNWFTKHEKRWCTDGIEELKRLTHEELCVYLLGPMQIRRKRAFLMLILKWYWFAQ